MCAQEARTQLGLDRVVLMPASGAAAQGDRRRSGGGRPPGACAGSRSPATPAWRSRGLELEREGPSYTADTLRLLHDREPGDELTFIVGGDMAESLPTWHEPREVLRLAVLAVAERDEARAEDLAVRLAPLHDGTRVRFFAMPRLDVSSSDLRARVADGRPIRHLVPDAVAAEIAARGWYRPTAGVSPTEQEHHG